MKKILLVSFLALLANCGSNAVGLKRQMGLITDGPDAYAVVPRTKLEQPSNLTNLPEPQPGAQARVELQPVQTVKKALLHADVAKNKTPSSPSGLEKTIILASKKNTGDAPVDSAGAAGAATQTSYALDEFLGYKRANKEQLDSKDEAKRLGINIPQAPSPAPR